ncbi:MULTISPECIES: hypothetical protein [unclassified Leucobacter]|uniref:hypothetical protein n=1 Tax=unclassified Leucobacter TaxID=2621730 RepID=UPI00165D4EE9|nr:MULTISPECIES: hypothetical protein [unclassified Leucobacter]MBC9926605.1 hypothetical protein [Leucobacter sp. cx-169]
MADRVVLDDAVLAEAGSALIAAAHLMVAENARRPSAMLESQSGIGDDVEQYMRGLQLARSALSRAARTASEAVADMMRDSDTLDRKIAGALSGGFSAKGGGR